MMAPLKRIILVAVGALECVTKEAEQYMKEIGIKIRTEAINKMANSPQSNEKGS